MRTTIHLSADLRSCACWRKDESTPSIVLWIVCFHSPLFFSRQILNLPSWSTLIKLAQQCTNPENKRNNKKKATSNSKKIAGSIHVLCGTPCSPYVLRGFSLQSMQPCNTLPTCPGVNPSHTQGQLGFSYPEYGVGGLQWKRDGPSEL